MPAKDAVYLSLLALTAVVFYWTGFYGGFNATLRIFKRQEEEDRKRAVDFEPVSEDPLLVPVAAAVEGEQTPLNSRTRQKSLQGFSGFGTGGSGHSTPLAAPGQTPKASPPNIYFGRN
jgi:hypothetical protein